MRQVVYENRAMASELAELKNQLISLEHQDKEEKTFFTSKIKNLEDQLASHQRSAIKREEEMQLEFLQKEQDMQNDLQKAQAIAENSQDEA